MMTTHRFLMRIKTKAARFKDGEGGVVFVLVALMMAILIGIAGFAIDYAKALDAKAQLQRAADAAALTAAKASTVANAQAALQSFVLANLSPDVKAMNPVPTLLPQDPKINCKQQAKVLLSATVPTPLFGIFGAPQIPVSVTSQAAGCASFFNIYAAVDQTGSMGIASDAANRANLQSLTGGCEFACHMPEGTPQSFYSIAKANNIQIREDVLNEAFSTFVTAVLTTNPDLTTQRAVDVLGFGSKRVDTYADPSTVAVVQELTQDATGSPGPSSDISTVQGALQNFTEDYKRNTYFEAVLPKVQAIMGPQGDGYTQANPRKMLVLITDGARSDRYWNTWPIENPIDGSGNALPSPNNCQAIKNSGITVAVIEVKYVQSPDYWFWYWLGDRRPNAQFTDPSAQGTVYSELSPALETCASRDPANASLPIGPTTGQRVWYFQATDSSAISSALSALLDAINQSSLRLLK